MHATRGRCAALPPVPPELIEAIRQAAAAVPEYTATQPWLVPHRRVWTVRWRAPTWLLLAWCLGTGGWILATALRPLTCPHGQYGCQLLGLHPLYRDPRSDAWWAVAAGSGATVLLAVWRRDRWRVREIPHVLPRRSRPAVLIVVSLLGVLGATQLLLLAPMTAKPSCATAIWLAGPRAYPLNCDSPEFMRLANHPRALLHRGSLRQSRPGYIALAAVATRLVGPAAHAIGLDRAFGATDRAYIPLILINLTLVVTAVALLASLAGRLGVPRTVTAALCLLLAVNDVTKAFFWSPHQQMFELLVPVATIAACVWVLRARPSWRAVAVLGVALGFAALVYASVLITVAAVGLLLLPRRRAAVAPMVALLTGFLAPQLAWVRFCTSVLGSYHNEEVSRYHEFIWLPEAALHGPRTLFAWVESNLVVTGREFGSALGFPLIVLCGLAVVAVLAGVRLDPVCTVERRILLATGVTIGCGTAFAFGIGIVATRIMYHVFPAVLLLIGWVAAKLAARSRFGAWFATVAVLSVAAMYVIRELTTYGPYS